MQRPRSAKRFPRRIQSGTEAQRGGEGEASLLASAYLRLSLRSHPQPIAEKRACTWLDRVGLLCWRMRQPHADVIRADADGKNDEGAEKVVHRPLPQRNLRGTDSEEPEQKAQHRS